MRIVFVSGSYPPIHCGISEPARDLVMSLAERHSITLITSRGVRIPIEASDAGIDWHQTGWGLASLGSVLRIIAKSKPDLVHLEYPCVPYGSRLLPVILPFLLRCAGIRTAARVHEFRAARLLRRVAIAFLASSSDYTLVPSQIDWRLLRRLPFMASRVGWLPNTSSVPVSELPPSEIGAQRELLAPGASVIGSYFGYFSRTKDVPTLCLAIRTLLRAVPRSKFLIIGGGNVWSGWRDYLNDLRVDSQVGDRIIWSDYVSLPRVSAFLQLSDFVLLPFIDAVDDRRTSFYAALEHGLPTVTTGNKADESRYPAVLVAPGDPAAFVAAALKIATERSERDRLASAARAFSKLQPGNAGERYERALAKSRHWARDFG